MDRGVDMEMDGVGSEAMSADMLSHLIANLQNQMDLAARVQSVKELSTIATALGPQRTREELLPFLIGCIDEDDEVADVICDELVKFGPLVGGTQFIHVLLPPLEAIAAGDEIITRNKAVEGLATLAKQMPVANMLRCMLPMIDRLVKGHWYTQRASACGLFHIVYSVSDSGVQRQLLEWLSSLSTDSAAMVRRAVAKSLEELIPAIDKSSLSELIHPIFLKLAQDEQDSVRLLVGGLCIDMSRGLTQEEIRAAVLPSLHKLMKDPAWRVRFVIADKFCELQGVVGEEISQTDLLTAFVELLGDGESEVRAAAAGQVVEFFRKLPETARIQAVLQGGLPKLQQLVNDEAQHVRCALASVIMGLAEIIGKEHTINFLLPLFLILLKDQFSDVRLKIISNLDSVNRVVGLNQLAQALEPAINELFSDENWRVRIATIELIPLVAKQLGVEYFNQELSVKFLNSLLDRIYSVRAATIDNIAKLVEYFGIDWAKESLLPRIVNLPTEKNTYVARLVTLLTINRLVDVCPKDIIEEVFVPVVCSFGKDKVANVRFNAGKVLEKLIPLVGRGVYDNKISAVLDASVADPDVDVRFYGTRAKNVAIQVFP